MRLWFAASLIGLAIPVGTFAMETTTWDFRDGQVPGPTDVAGLDLVQPEELGLHVRTSQQGRILRPMDVPLPVHAVTIAFRAPVPVQAILLWHPRNLPEDTLVQLPVSVEAGESAARINMVDFPAWDSRSDRIGLAFPAGTDLHIIGMQFHQWSVAEQLAELWKSFWKFDVVQAYSINFLWGPVLTRTAFGTEALHANDPPPRGWSLNRFLLPVLAAAGLALLAHRRLRGASRRHAAIFAGIAAALWLAFDFRMGLELLSYAKTDYDTYISQPEGSRSFRATQYFTDVVQQSLPMLREDPVFGFVAPPSTPYAAYLRYFAYPSAPAAPDDGGSIRTWLIFARPDIVAGSGGRLVSEGKPFTPPGTIVKTFQPGTFLFRVR